METGIALLDAPLDGVGVNKSAAETTTAAQNVANRDNSSPTLISHQLRGRRRRPQLSEVQAHNYPPCIQLEVVDELDSVAQICTAATSSAWPFTSSSYWVHTKPAALVVQLNPFKL